MSGLADLNLPDLPEGHRWKVYNDFLGHPKISIEKKGRYFWSQLSNRWIFPENRGQERAIEDGARKLHRETFIDVKYYEPYEPNVFKDY